MEEHFCYQVLMREPSVRSSRLAIAAGLALIILVGGGGFLLGRATAPRSQPSEARPKVVKVISPPPVYENVRILGRADLLQLAARGADAYASAQPWPSEVAEASGKRFILSLPFGCSGPAPEDSADPMRWRFEEKEGVLRAQAMPTLWTAEDWRLPDERKVSEIAGFWIERPWSSSESCPPSKVTASLAATGHEPDLSVAIARFRSKEEQERPVRKTSGFEIVRRIDGDELDGSRGFRLQLTGRLGGGDDPLHCTQTAGPDERPKCVWAATFDEIRLENGATGAVLAVWDSRSGSDPLH
ncbi:hypothetical protein [Sphingobium indicum]|uniref:hypothetical protein n=1 Tax=Sphingobium indicum TaxID=332055 RepID=UPI0011E060E6|nr:hypothetical protein [Sphingobium indicum]